MLPLATGLPGGAERRRLREYIIWTAAQIRLPLWLSGRHDFGDEFEPLKAGSLQRFCAAKYRDGFHSAARRWAEHAVLSGFVTAADLRIGPSEACTLPGARNAGWPTRA